MKYRLTLAAGCLVAGATLQADTVDNFDGNGTPSTFDQFGAGDAPRILGGGPTGDFLRLINRQNSQNNSVSYDLTDPGQFSSVDASFHFSANNGNSAADGFSFTLAPTGEFGTMGTGVPWGTPGFAVAEEPNRGGVFAVGFDLWQGINEISGHWNGRNQVSVNPDPNATVDLNSGVRHLADIEVQRVGNGSNVKVTITPDANAPLAITAVEPGAAGMIDITFDSVDGYGYAVDAAPTATGPWSEIVGGITGTGGSTTAGVPSDPVTKEFYRVRRTGPPPFIYYDNVMPNMLPYEYACIHNICKSNY